MGLTVFANEIRITPGADNSFVVRLGESFESRAAGLGSMYGFTNVTDLMTWLQRAAQAQQAAEVTVLDQPYEGGAIGKADDSAAKPAMWPAERAGFGTMRTTALGSLADRLAAAETPKGAA